MNINIERKIDENTKEEYWFYLFDDRQTLYLDVYGVMKRESPRHKFKSIKVYSRLDHPGNLGREDRIKLKDITLTDEIKNEALDKPRAMVKVDTWKDA